MRHTWRTIGYFTVWGTAYGFIIGFLSGATAWIAGALLGACYGTVVGAVLGVIIGIMTALIHTWVFHQDIDIARYRRHLAAFNGLLVFTVGFSVLVFFITDALKRPPQDTTLAHFYPLAALFIPKTTILTALCVAYMSSHYPDWLIRTFYSPDPPRRSYSVLNAFINLWKSFFSLYRFVFVIALTSLLYIGEVLQSFQMTLSLFNMIGLLIIGLALSLGTFPFLSFYISVGNAVLLTFVKRLLFDEGLIAISTYHYKSVITCLSFLFTMLMTAWGWVLAPFYNFKFFDPVSNPHSLIMIAPPILGLLAAYHVSNTLALSNDDKNKRKEMTHEAAT